MGQEWRISSFSGADNNCVELRRGEDVAVRDSKHRDGGSLRLPAHSLDVLIATVRR